MNEESEYIKDLETSKLVGIIQDIFGFEETSAALLELYNRDNNKVFELGIDILKNNKGDDYLQATVFDIIYDINPKGTIDSLSKRKSDIGVILLGDIMSEVSMEYYKKVQIEITDKFLFALKERYNSLSEDEKEKIFDCYVEFEEDLKHKQDLKNDKKRQMRNTRTLYLSHITRR